MRSHIGSDQKAEQNEFVNRAKGSLPERITEADLDTLNSGLRFLFADLREAQRLFSAEEDGRAGAFAALGALRRFIVLFQAPYAETLAAPILVLLDGLGMLESGSVMPMLKPRKRRGHPLSSHRYAALRGNAVATVKLLSDSGLGHPQAYRQVAERLKKLGIRPTRGSGEITAATIADWYEKDAEDIGRHEVEAMACDARLTDIAPRLAALPQDQARRLALDGLAAFAQILFPKGGNR